jgi:hypothetical protein
VRGLRHFGRCAALPGSSKVALREVTQRICGVRASRTAETCMLITDAGSRITKDGIIAASSDRIKPQTH